MFKLNKTTSGMPRISIRGGSVPRSLISKRVKILPVLFTRIGAGANSGRVSLARGNLKSLRLSLARSISEPEVGYAGDDPPPTWGSSMPLWGRAYRM
jgi:hypothetical protein